MSRPTTALVIGEALIDIVRSPGAPQVIETPGGSPMNVAITLARLGVPTAFATALGNDERGDRIREHLAASGVAEIRASRPVPRTSSAVATLRDDGSASYCFDITWDPDLTGLPAADVVHAGSIGLLLEPGASAVGDALVKAATSSLVSLDPNIRPALFGSQASVRARIEGLAEHADVVKLSDEDAAWLYPHRDPAETVSHVLSLGASLAVVTLGAAGSLLASATARVHVPAPETRVADTIGAGDSYMGALLHQLLEHGGAARLRTGPPLDGPALEAIGSFAAAVAAVTVSRQGANPPRLEEVTSRG
jgi:fructokinase